MTKIAIIVKLILIASQLAAAQEVSLMFHMGAATYRMKSQKDLQDDFRGTAIPWKPVDRFPPYWIFGGSCAVHFNPRMGASIYFEYGSTGGRLHYEDYSGSANFTQLLRYAQFGLGAFSQINRSERWPLFATGHISISRTVEELSYSIIVGNSSEGENETFKAINLGLRPGLMMQRRIKMFLFQANLGYELQFPGGLENEEGIPLTLQDGDNVYAQWSGLRATIGVGLMLGRRKD